MNEHATIALGQLINGVEEVSGNEGPLADFLPRLRQSFSVAAREDRIVDRVEEREIETVVTIALANFYAATALAIGAPDIEIAPERGGVAFDIAQNYAAMITAVIVAITLDSVHENIAASVARAGSLND
ncbi:MAG: hypothetical protein IPH08_04010 [Rhodocyclaceae bacterium]|nr:hypothetical protein [Rhodocyclaceae bacterium]